MQTTLRIDDRIYRDAKAEAARQGKTVTRFIEEALELKLKQRASRGPVNLPTFAAGDGFNYDPEELKTLARNSQTRHDQDKLKS